ncbi:endochitinase A isoform X2 [Lingula anatina]|uniref:Endochitinase A isoform X2 n=1 Tax=Lingula anatina TaxID=7574 RepID=A0A1S3JC37_LINAN|nr:endochitinase A isoform X2 [Lingula anatina]|eukprot:XP_013407967.1 endochitinase A isoform X2 [Lingula anatina]
MTLTSRVIVTLCIFLLISLTERRSLASDLTQLENDSEEALLRKLIAELEEVQAGEELQALSRGVGNTDAKTENKETDEDMLHKLKAHSNSATTETPMRTTSTTTRPPVTTTTTTTTTTTSTATSSATTATTKPKTSSTMSSAAPPATTTSTTTTSYPTATTRVTPPFTSTARPPDDFDMVISIMELVRKWRKAGLLAPLAPNAKSIDKPTEVSPHANKYAESSKSSEADVTEEATSTTTVPSTSSTNLPPTSTKLPSTRMAATASDQTTVTMETASTIDVTSVPTPAETTDGASANVSKKSESDVLLELAETSGKEHNSKSESPEDDSEKTNKDKEKRLLLRLLIKKLNNAGKTREELVWPHGNWGLPRLGNQRCPGESPVWSMGTRTQDTENDMPGNKMSLAYPSLVGGNPGKSVMTQSFCMKSDVTDDGDPVTWPAGEYCIYRYKGSCPKDFDVGFIQWDDENTNNKNSRSGELPDGIYGTNTQIEFCCRTDGKWSDDVTLPTAEPFLLLQKNPMDCQRVAGMDASQTWFQWDTEDETRGASSAGSVPYNGVTKDGEVKLHYCTYFPSKRR